MRPVVALTFSNDQDNYLEMLKRESSNIFKALRDFDDKDFIKLYREESSTMEEVLDLFIHYLDRLAIFHYGGHANGTHLQLETTSGRAELAYSGGLAQLMGLQKELKLVFLNCCATKGQVELLFASGVKAVIATSVLIGDTMAVEFAEKFYEALAQQATIQKAFEIAKACIATAYGLAREINLYRDLNRSGEKAAPEAELPWGLYINGENPEVLEWKLPTVKRYHITPSALPAKGEVNTELIKKLFKEVEKFHENNWAQQCYKNDGELDIRVAKGRIIDSFPMPVGEQLRQIFDPDSAISVERLQQLVVAYNTMVEFLCFILLSQLWDVKYKNPGISIPKNNLLELVSFFALNAGNYKTFNYVKLIEAIAGIFKKNQVKCFIEELNTSGKCIPDQEGEFYKAHLFMEEMKVELFENKNKAEPEEINSFCYQAEEHLGTILAKLSFLVKYKLAAIKSIKVIRRKQKRAKYNHRTVMLDKVTLGTLDEESTFDSFTDNKSVILLKHTGDVKEYLSLSPFVIDENALTDIPGSKVFFFSYPDLGDGKSFYHYKLVKNDMERLIVSGEKFPEVKDQHEDFKNDVFK